VGAAEPPGVGSSHSEDETPRPPDFVPHVMRIAHLMDQKVHQCGIFRWKVVHWDILMNSVKYSRPSSHSRWLNGKYSHVSRTISMLLVRELTTSEIHCGHDIPAHYSWWQDMRFGGRRQVHALLGPGFTFRDMFVTGDNPGSI
jgi:hypothetical protein